MILIVSLISISGNLFLKRKIDNLYLSIILYFIYAILCKIFIYYASKVKIIEYNDIILLFSCFSIFFFVQLFFEYKFLFISFVILSILVSSEISYLILQLLEKYNHIILECNLEFIYMRISTTSIFLIINVIYLILFGLKKEKDSNKTKIKKVVFINFLLINLVLVTLITVNTICEKKYEFNSRQILYLIMFLFLIVVIALLLLLIFIYNKRKEILKLKYFNEILNSKYKIQKKIIKSKTENDFEVKRLAHDIKNHINLLNILVQKNDIKKVKEYLEKFEITTKLIEDKKICNHEILNALFSLKIECMTEYNIEYNFDINVPDSLKIKDFDLCTIFGNLLDNSIESCISSIENNIKPYIYTKVYIKNNYLFIYISNSTINNKIKCIDELQTTKKDKENHGIGLKSVKKSIEKYNGDITVKNSENDFTINIYLEIIY